MATVTPAVQITIGPRDAGRTMTLDEFIAADWQEGYLYELARGVVVVTSVPHPRHGRIVRRIARVFDRYDEAYPRTIKYAAGGAECRLRLPGLMSDRHPDQAIYLTPEPSGTHLWHRWTPAIVVEVVSRSAEARDYVEKREEYLHLGVLEYWIFDSHRRKMMALKRNGDVWVEQELGDAATYRTELLPGLEVSVGTILGPALDEDEDAAGEALADAPPGV